MGPCYATQIKKHSKNGAGYGEAWMK